MMAQRKTKYLFLLLVVTIIVFVNIHLWHYTSIFNPDNDTYNTIRHNSSFDIDIYDNDFDDYNATGDHPKYQDEDFTEEEIRLFGPLEEREVQKLYQNTYSYSQLRFPPFNNNLMFNYLLCKKFFICFRFD